ncbi:MAG: VOC family protein, partial [Verrucomicrobiota bacterium]|nr:VOC family protein [Verrucomicrobiota bacterium]
EFYMQKLGMGLNRRIDNEPGRFSLAFVGFEGEQTVVELTYNWDQDEDYDLGSGFGHLAIGVDDIYATCEELAQAGVSIPRPAGPMKGSPAVIAFIEDPDGYKIELVQNR